MYRSVNSILERKRARRCQSPSSSRENERYKKRRHSRGDDKPGRSWKRKERKNSFSKSSGSSSSDSDRDKIRKKRRKLKKEKKRQKEKRKKDKRRKRKKNREEENNASELSGTAVTCEDLVTVLMPPENQATKRRPMVPMTKEEYERQQSQVRRVFDAETGRNRLVKGDGEVIEEVVSYQRHKEINKQATAGDGTTFQKFLGLQK